MLNYSAKKTQDESIYIFFNIVVVYYLACLYLVLELTCFLSFSTIVLSVRDMYT